MRVYVSKTQLLTSFEIIVKEKKEKRPKICVQLVIVPFEASDEGLFQIYIEFKFNLRVLNSNIKSERQQQLKKSHLFNRICNYWMTLETFGKYSDNAPFKSE